MMKIFLTGGTGFVGQEILAQLVDAGFRVRCLVRPGSESSLPQLPGVEIHKGDAADSGSLVSAMSDCRAAINLIGIIREFPGHGVTFPKMHVAVTENLITAAQKQGVQRYLQMSANGTRADAITDYHKTKWQAEEIVRKSTLDWTIFRPSLIYGPDDQFVNMLADMMRKLPVMPVMGGGEYQLQPVSVANIAQSFVLALTKPDSIAQTFHCGGPDCLSYNQVLNLIGKALGKSKVRKIHQPLFLMKPIVSMLEGFSAFPITKGQLQMLLEENCCDHEPWQQFFGIEQKSFEEGIAGYLKKGKKGQG